MGKQVVIDIDASGRIVRIDVKNPADACARGESDELLAQMQQFLSDRGIELVFDEVRPKSPEQIRNEHGAAAPLPAFVQQQRMEHHGR